MEYKLIIPTTTKIKVNCFNTFWRAQITASPAPPEKAQQEEFSHSSGKWLLY